MAKRKVESQIGSLTPDHYKSGIDLISLCVGGVRHTVGKLSMTVTSYKFASKFILHFNRRSAHKVMGPQSCRSPNFGNFQDSHLGVLGQNVIWMWASWKGTKYTIRGKVWVVVNLVSSSLLVVRPSTKSAKTMH
jgi:hypothetical protein